MALPKAGQLLPQSVLRATKPEQVSGVFKMAVFTKDNVQWPDGSSINKLLQELMRRAEGVEFIDEMTLPFQGRHIWLRIQFVADTTPAEAKRFAFGIEQLLKERRKLEVGSLEELKKRPKNRVPGLGRTSRNKRRRATPQPA